MAESKFPQNINMDGNKITNHSAPSSGTDVTNKDYVDDYVETYAHAATPSTAYVRISGDTVYGPIASVQTPSSSIAFSGKVTGDSQNRWTIDESGSFSWGDGAAFPLDTKLYRFATDVLKTDDAYVVGGSYLSVGTTPATAGVLRLPNNNTIRWRNAANSADIDGIQATSSNYIQLGGTAAAGTSVAAGSTRTLWVGSLADGTTEAAGIHFGLSADTNLYRLATSQLKTDDSFIVGTGGTLSVQNGISNTQILLGYNGANYQHAIKTVHNGATASGNYIDFRIWTPADAVGTIGSVQAARLNGVGQLALPGNGSSAGLLIGADTNLYRSAADVLNTDDAYVVGGSYLSIGTTPSTTGVLRIPNANVVKARNAANSADFDLIQATSGNSVQVGGSGSTSTSIAAGSTRTLWVDSLSNGTTESNGIHFGLSADTNLYRSAANTLKTDDTFVVPNLQSVQTPTPSNTSLLFSYTGAGNYLGASPIGGKIWHDLLAYAGLWWPTPTFERYNGSWSSTTLDKSVFANKEANAATIIDGVTYTAARWTWNPTNVAYSYPEWWALGFSYGSPATTKDILLESSVDGSAWTTRHSSTGNTANAMVSFVSMTANGSDPYVRLTITVTNSQPLYMSAIKAYSTRWGNQGGGSEKSFPYTWDNDGRITIGSGTSGIAGTTALSNGALNIGGSAPTTAAQGIYFGTDVALYRSAADTLTTDDDFVSVSGASTTARNKGIYVYSDKAFGVSLVYKSTWATGILTRTVDGVILFGKASGAYTLQSEITEFGRFTNAGVLEINSTGTPGTDEKFRVNSPVVVDNDAVAIMTAAVADQHPLVVQGFTAQTANLQEWQDSTGAVLAQVKSGGSILLAATQGLQADYVTDRATTGAYIQTNASGTNSGAVMIRTRADANVGLTIRANSVTQSANLQEWQDSSSTVLASMGPQGKLSLAGTVEDVSGGSSIAVNSTMSSTTVSQYGIRTNPSVSPGSASSQTYVGVLGQLNSSSSNLANATLIGVQGNPYNSGTGTTLATIALYAGGTNSSTGTITTHYGLRVVNPTNSGGGTITANYGIYVLDQTSGGTDYGIAIGGADTQVLWLSSQADNTDAANGIAFGSSRDTNLYRSAANTLKTDDTFAVGAAFYVDSGTGYTRAAGITNYANTGAYLSTTAVSGSLSMIQRITTNINLIVKAVAAQTADLQQWHDSASTTLARVGPSGDVGAPSFANAAFNSPYLQFQPTYARIVNRNTTTNNVFQVQGMAAQTGDLQQWQNSSSTVLTSIGPQGKLSFGGTVDDLSNGSQLNLTSTMASTTNSQYGARITPTVAPGSASSMSYIGVLGGPVSGGSNTTSSALFGFYANPYITTTGTVGSVVGLRAVTTNTTTGTISANVGLSVLNPSNGGGGTITNNYGVHVETQTAGTNDYGIRVDAADTQTLWVSGNANNTTAAAGIAFGSSRDTNLYRSAADTLKTDDTFVAGAGLTVASLTGVLRADSGVVSVDTSIASTYLPLAGGTMSGDIDLDGNDLVGVYSISNSVDAAWGIRFTGGTIQIANLGSPAVANQLQWTNGYLTNLGKMYLSASLEVIPRIDEVVQLIKGFSSQTANLLEFRTSAGTLLTQFDASGKLVFGSSADTNLYRSAADTLATDDNFALAGTSVQSFGSATGDKLRLYSNTYGIGIESSNLTQWASNFRWRTGGTSVSSGTAIMALTSAGQLQVSTTGSSAGILLGGDANLYRSAADTLKTDDAFVVAGSNLLVPDGSVSIPGIAFNGDTNTGLYMRGVGDVAFALNGVTVGYFTDNYPVSITHALVLGANDTATVHSAIGDIGFSAIDASGNVCAGLINFAGTGLLMLNNGADGVSVVGNASGLTISGNGTGVAKITHADGTASGHSATKGQMDTAITATYSATATITNKRITRRVTTASDATSITPAGDTSDVVIQGNTQALGTLTINAPTGTPTDGQELTLRIKSTNVQTFSFNGIYRGSTDTPLPTATYAGSTTCYMKFMYNSTDTKWDMVSVTDGY